MLIVEVKGEEGLVNFTRGVMRGLINFETMGVWKKIKPLFHKIMKKIFDTEGSSGKSGKWAALSPKYARIKAQKYGNLPILQRSGQLYRHMTGSDAIFSKGVNVNQLVVNLGVPGRFHQTGTRTPMPARPIVDMTEEDLQAMNDAVAERLVELIKKEAARH